MVQASEHDVQSWHLRRTNESNCFQPHIKFLSGDGVELGRAWELGRRRWRRRSRAHVPRWRSHAGGGYNRRMMQRVSARERLVAAAPSAFVLDKDMGAPMMTDAARFAVTNADGRPVVPLTAAQKYHFDTKGWLAVPGVLDVAEIEEMRDFVLRLKADPESIPEHQRSPVGGPLQRLTDHPVVIGFAQEFIYNPFTDGGGDSLENDHGYGFRQEHSFITVRRSAGGRRGAHRAPLRRRPPRRSGRRLVRPPQRQRHDAAAGGLPLLPGVPRARLRRHDPDRVGAERSRGG